MMRADGTATAPSTKVTLTLSYAMNIISNAVLQKKSSTPYLAASHVVFAIFPFVPLTPCGTKKIMKITVFLFSKFICLPFFFGS